MKGRRTLKVVIALAIVSAAAIVGLLLTDGVFDWALMVLAALPLFVGIWCWRAEAGKAGRTSR